MNYLENSSNCLIDRVKVIQKHIETTVNRCVNAGLQFDNLHNEFVSLSSRQFVENVNYNYNNW